MLNKVKYWILGILTALAFSAGIAYAVSWNLPPAIQRGDLIVATSTTQAVRLATSSKGSVLWVNPNGVPAWTATSTLGISGGGCAGSCLTSFAAMTGPAITIATSSD